MATRRRSIEQLIEEQAHRWQLRTVERSPEVRRPVITLSRQHGAGGEALARRLADTLGLEIFDKEIIQRIAANAGLREREVAAFDERQQALVDQWLAPFAAQRYLTQYDYLHHLIGVVAAIARHGGVVIVGRGAHLLLRPGESLRVMVVAPLERRVATVADEEGVSPLEARERIETVESERRAFLLQYFHAEWDDPSHFDLTVNPSVLGEAGALAVIRSALSSLNHLLAERPDAWSGQAPWPHGT